MFRFDEVFFANYQSRIYTVSAGKNPSRFKGVLTQWLSECSILLKRYQGLYRLPLTPLEKYAQEIDAPLKRKNGHFFLPSESWHFGPKSARNYAGVNNVCGGALQR